MTKKLEQLLNLATTPSEDIQPEQAETFIKENQLTIAEVDNAIDKIDAALPLVRDLEAGDQELDDLAKLAQDKFEDLMDLGMNVDSRFAGTILQTAGVLLGHAITAKTAKMDKKLRTIQLQLSKQRLDLQAQKVSDEPIEGQGVVLDRNALLQQILNQNKTNK